MTIHDVETGFSSAELAARALALCGWAAADTGLDVVRAVLAGDPVAADRHPAPSVWTSAERSDPEHAPGPARTVVVLTSDTAATVRIAMGSLAWAPAAAGTPAWTVALGPGKQVVVDGRCAFRVDAGTATAARWTAA